MSLRMALKALRDLGLTDTEAQVYVYLAKKGPHEEEEIATALNVTKHQLGLSLESLVTRGMATTVLDRSTKYSAIPLEKVLDQFMKAAKEQAKALQASREELLSTWRSLSERESSNS